MVSFLYPHKNDDGMFGKKVTLGKPQINDLRKSQTETKLDNYGITGLKKQNNNKKEDKTQYLPIFMSIGLSLGIAIGAGSEIAIDSADVILSKSSLCDAVSAISLSCATVTVIKENLFSGIIGCP